MLPLAPGMIDPLYLHELAERLHMTIGDLERRASAHELTVEWPAYDAAKARMRQTEEARGVPVIG